MAGLKPILLSFPEDKLKEVEKAIEKFDFLRFTVVDMNGVPRGKMLPSEEVHKFLKSGVGCFAGLHAIGPNNETVVPKEVSDAYSLSVEILPDLNTLHFLPWVGNNKYKFGQFMCETYWDLKTPQQACTRHMARRQLQRLDDMGLKFYSGMELEFVAINEKSKEPVFRSSDYLSMQMHSEFDTWFGDIYKNIKDAGVSIQMMHAENSPGQFEFTVVPKYGIEAADASVILKQGIKDMAKQRGWQASFMAQLFPDYPGNGGHFNFSVWSKDSNENLFWDGNQSDGISEFARYWIAGMMKHAKALTALCCITTNCYQRLHKTEVPDRANWGIKNKHTMLRVRTGGPEMTYIENRLPSGLFNPYIVMAASIAAGLDGVNNKLPCPEPYDFERAPFLPYSLEEALTCLQQDEVLVDILGETFVEWFVQSKAEVDLRAIEDVIEEDQRLQIEIKQYAKLM